MQQRSEEVSWCRLIEVYVTWYSRLPLITSKYHKHLQACLYQRWAFWGDAENAVFGRPFVKRWRPFVKRFALCVLSVLSVTLVYCGQTIGWIKIKLGTDVGLGPGHIMLDEDPAPPLKKGAQPQFSAHICCVQAAGWIKMPLTEVNLGLGDIVLDGDPATPRKGARHPAVFGLCLLWPNGRPSLLLLSTCQFQVIVWYWAASCQNAIWYYWCVAYFVFSLVQFSPFLLVIISLFFGD